jgi:acetate kinase
MRILVVNPGSSSVKLRVLGADDSVVLHRDIACERGALDVEELSHVVENGPPFDAAGVRVVHGADVRATSVVDDNLADRLAAAVDLAPLHNPPALGVIRMLRRARPGLPVVACLDTAFHASLPDAAATYAVPWQWTERWGIRRYGFHGFSHAYASGRAAELARRPLEQLRVVTCHLGAGASLAAVAGGRSVDTTMGFTPLDGLVMATRSGSVDPGALLWLQRHAGLTADAAEKALDQESGLLALSGVSGYMPDVLAAAGAGNARARLAIDVYVHRLRAGIAAMTTALGGLDALVFTGGVGEGSHEIRAAATGGVAFLGVAIDESLNRRVERDEDADLTARSATVSTFVVHAREDLAIAAEVRRVVDSIRRER